MEKVNPIVISFEDGKEYTLEFNRETVSTAEKRGFSRESAGDKMMTMLPELFYYSFMMHHPSISREKTDKILFEELGGLTTDEIGRLVDLFDAPYKTLIHEEEEEGERKNSRVSVRL